METYHKILNVTLNEMKLSITPNRVKISPQKTQPKKWSARVSQNFFSCEGVPMGNSMTTSC